MPARIWKAEARLWHVSPRRRHRVSVRLKQGMGLFFPIAAHARLLSTDLSIPVDKKAGDASPLKTLYLPAL